MQGIFFCNPLSFHWLYIFLGPTTGQQWQKIRILFTHNGLVSILKQMSIPPIPEIVSYRISTQKLAHHGRHALCAAAQEYVCMIRHECPRVDGGTGTESFLTKEAYEIILIPCILDDTLPLYSTKDDVMQRSGCVESRSSGHKKSSSTSSLILTAGILPCVMRKVNLGNNVPYCSIVSSLSSMSLS